MIPEIVGTILYRNQEIQLVRDDASDLIIEYRRPYGLFLNISTMCAIDNTTADAFCESFNTIEEALNWLAGCPDFAAEVEL